MTRISISRIFRKSGFTLVEIIMVISIIAILTTVSFITYSNMSSEARNSVRKTDMLEMKVRLRGVAQRNGAFPLPSNGIAVTNSGFLAIHQGWSDSIETDNGSSFRKDPKANHPYMYATITNRQSYQIGMTLELGSDTYGSYVDGNYNPIVPDVFPSLLLATDTVGTFEIHDGIGSGSINRTKFIVPNGTLNLPYGMNGTVVAKGESFTGIIGEVGVQISRTSKYSDCQSIIDAGQYLGAGEYIVIDSSGVLTTTLCGMSPSTQVNGSCTNLPAHAVYYNATGSYTLVNANSGTTLDAIIAGYSVPPANNTCQFSCDTLYTWNGTSCVLITRYPSCDTDDIFLTNGQVWSACNVGATNAYTGVVINNGTASPFDGNLTIRNTLGSYFQWGRNDDVTGEGIPTATLASTGVVGHTNFIMNSSGTFDWLDPQDDSIWGGSGTTSSGGTFSGQTLVEKSLMQGPCAPGYHIPTQYEWCMAIQAISPDVTVCDENGYTETSPNAFKIGLKFPYAGLRKDIDATFDAQNFGGYYWTATPSGTGAFNVVLSGSLLYPAVTHSRASGASVRCLLN